MSEKVVLCAGWPGMRGEYLTSDHIPAENEGESAVANVLKLPALHITWSHGQARMLALQCLHTGQFVSRECAFALFLAFGRQSVDRTYIGNLGIQLWIVRGCQPVADAMGL